MDHATLVCQIKELQKTNQDAKQAWGNYCDTKVGKVRDPNKHDANFLSTFISSYNSGSLQGKGMAGGKGIGGGKGMGVGNNMGGTDQMLSMLCTIMGLGGADSGGGGGGTSASASASNAPPGDMSGFVKSGQRSSPSFRVAWQAYCTGYGTPKFDPSVYDRQFIAGFAEYLGTLAAKDLGAEALIPPDAGQKRPVPFTGGTAKRIKTLAIAEMDPVKAELVNRVKQIQRSVAGGKEAWCSFSDAGCAGVRDPAKIEDQSLRNFLSQYAS